LLVYRWCLVKMIFIDILILFVCAFRNHQQRRRRRQVNVCRICWALLFVLWCSSSCLKGLFTSRSHVSGSRCCCWPLIVCACFCWFESLLVILLLNTVKLNLREMLFVETYLLFESINHQWP